jgi:hypothetical protein
VTGGASGIGAEISNLVIDRGGAVYMMDRQPPLERDGIVSLDVPTQLARFGAIAFHWTQFVDLEPYISRLDKLLFDELGVGMIAPTHGLPLRDRRRPPARELLRDARGRVK